MIWDLSFLLQVLCAVAKSCRLICLCGAVLCEYHGMLSLAVCLAESLGASGWVAGHLRCGTRISQEEMLRECEMAICRWLGSPALSHVPLLLSRFVQWKP